jgi:hypothetical protein
MSTVSINPGPDELPDPLGVVVVAERFLNQTGVPGARLGNHNAAAATRAARSLIAALMTSPALGFTNAQRILYDAVCAEAPNSLDGQLVALSNLACTADPSDVTVVQRWLNDQVSRVMAR